MNIKCNREITGLMNQIDMSVTGSGYVTTDTTWFGENICSPYSRLYYVESGEGVLEYSNKKVIMRPGFIYLIPAGLLYNYRCDNSISKLFFHVNIFKPSGYDLIAGTGQCLTLPISLEKVRYLTHLYYSKNYMDAFLLKNEIYGVLIEMLNSLSYLDLSNMDFSEPIQQTISFIRNNLSLKLNTAMISKSLYISESTLAKKFKSETGVSIGKYTDDMIFFKAENLLQKTTLPIKQISDILGFCDQFYFSRRFRQRYRESPSEYRNKVKAMKNI